MDTLNTIKRMVLGEGEHDDEKILRWIEFMIEREKEIASTPNPDAKTLYSQGYSPLPWQARNTPRGDWFIIAESGEAKIDVAHLESDGDIFANPEADAAFIVQAVNAHDELVAACKKALQQLAVEDALYGEIEAVQNQLRAALAKAAGETPKTEIDHDPQ